MSPRRAARPCSHPGCPGLVRGRGSYCETHEREHRDRYELGRGSSASRGYGARWRRLRKIFLAAHPLCEDPYGIHASYSEVSPSTDVDHIIARKDGGTDEWNNLQALCHECHSRKTAIENGNWG